MLEKHKSQRRKDDRPQEILAAALEEFALNGYAATRLDNIARRVGISKGTIYLYFDSKEKLFKAMVRNSVVPQVERFETFISTFDGSSEELVHLLLKKFHQELIASEKDLHILRLLIAEGYKFPELTDFYYREVIQREIAAIQMIVAQGVSCGEFRETAAEDFPQIIVAPALMGLVWKLLFEQYHPLDLDALFETYIDLIMNGLKRAQEDDEVLDNS